MSAPLPEYRRPPVVEVMLAVAFAPLPLSIVDLSEFGRDELLATLPNVQEQPPVQMPIEPPLGHRLAPAIEFSLLQGPPSPRLWFRSADGKRLVQLQRDWFACNWQDVTQTIGSYERFPTIEAFFEEHYGRFARFVVNKTGEEPAPVQCEVTYINHLHPTTTWDRPGQADRVNRLVGMAGNYLPEPEDVVTMVRYPMQVEGQTAGRLHITLAPAVGATSPGPLLELTLIGRGAPRGAGLAGVQAMFHLAHEWIVEGFAAVATPAAEDDWERIRG